MDKRMFAIWRARENGKLEKMTSNVSKLNSLATSPCMKAIKKFTTFIYHIKTFIITKFQILVHFSSGFCKNPKIDNF